MIFRQRLGFVTRRHPTAAHRKSEADSAFIASPPQLFPWQFNFKCCVRTGLHLLLMLLYRQKKVVRHHLTSVLTIFYIVCMQRRTNQPERHAPLGEFEALVLMAVLQLGETAYGMTIHQELEERGGRKCSYGALYTTLDRMEQKGYVSSSVGEATPERGGRAKKYFRIQAPGQAALQQSLSTTRKMSAGLEPQLGGAL